MSTHCVEFLCEVCAKTHAHTQRERERERERERREREREREREHRHIARWLPVTAAELL
jgi:pyrroloquinoline quinone (PQQ) biosynthesis protein C